MRLSDCFLEIIAYTAFVADSHCPGSPGYDQVNSTMHRLISNSEAYLQDADFSLEDFQLAKFAVFAWVDESFLASSWEGRHQWQRDQLQQRYFQTADAGELFFDKLNVIGPHQRDVHEVYYLCLSLGFTGQYCKQGDERLLDQLRRANLRVLTASSMGMPSLEKERLFPEAYPPDGEEDPSRLQWGHISGFTIMWLVLPVAVSGLLYLIFLFILNNIGDQLISAGL